MSISATTFSWRAAFRIARLTLGLWPVLLFGQETNRTPDEVEVPFALVLGGQVIRGRIDAVYTDAGGVQVVDWKTGAARRANPLQLAVYRVAWAEIAGLDVADVDAVFYDVQRDEVIRPRGLLGRPQLERLVERLAGPR